MRISRQSKFIRWCWWYNEWELRAVERSSICELFWRGFVISPIVVCLCLFGVSSIIYVVGKGLYLMWTMPVMAWSVGGICVAALLSMSAIYCKRKWYPSQRKTPPVAFLVLVERVKAAKKKACPIVELYEDE